MADNDTLDRPAELPDQADDRPAPASSLSPAPAGGFLDDVKPPSQEMFGALADTTRAQGNALEQSGQELDRHLAQDRVRMDKAYSLEAAAASDPSLKPWNADEEKAKRTTGPMESFGSVGSIFAMAASLFTRAPMTSALNAGAAAMNAIKAGDEKAYDQAYDAWKSNTDLALKRFGMEHQVFSDANALMSSDMGAWRAKQMAIAAQFDNKKAQIFLDNGMDKELLDMYHGQERAAIEMQRSKNEFEDYNRDRRIFSDGIASFKEENPNATPQQELQYKLQLIHDIKSGARSWQQEALRNFELTNPNATVEQRTQFMQSLRGGAGPRTLSPEQEFTKRFYEQNPAASPEEFSAAFGEFKKGQKAGNPDQKFISEFYQDHPDATAEEFSKAFGEWKKGQKTAAGGPGGGGNTTLTMDRQNAAAVAKQREVWKGEGKSEAEINDLAAKMYAKLKSESTPITATNRDQIDSMLTRIDTADQAIDKAEAMLKKHGALTGLGGKITRPAEVVGNWFGNNETDRAQFRRYIEEIRELGPRLIQESKSRPLSSEEKRIAAIVPGLDAGDTTQNTARGLKELQDLFKKLRAGLEARRGGTFEPSKPFGGATPGESKPAAGSKAPWESAPIKVPADKRSESGNSIAESSSEILPLLNPLAGPLDWINYAARKTTGDLFFPSKRLEVYRKKKAASQDRTYPLEGND